MNHAEIHECIKYTWLLLSTHKSDNRCLSTYQKRPFFGFIHRYSITLHNIAFRVMSVWFPTYSPSHPITITNIARHIVLCVNSVTTIWKHLLHLYCVEDNYKLLFLAIDSLIHLLIEFNCSLRSANFDFYTKFPLFFIYIFLFFQSVTCKNIWLTVDKSKIFIFRILLIHRWSRKINK